MAALERSRHPCLAHTANPEQVRMPALPGSPVHELDSNEMLLVSSPARNR